jgi:hypothetical protein
MGFQWLVESRGLEKEAIAAESGRGKHARARHTTPIGDGDGIGVTAFFPIQDTHPVRGGRGMREWPGSAGDQDVSYAPASLDSAKRSWAAVSRSMTYIGPWQRGHCQVASLFEDDASGAGFGW